MLILEIKRTYKQRRKIMKFENCKAASSEIQVEGMRSVTSVRDAANCHGQSIWLLRLS